MSLTVTSLLAILACGLSWSGFDLFRKLLVERIPPLPLLLVLVCGQIPLFVAWTAAVGAGPPGPGYWAPALGSVALNVAGNVAFLYAVALSPLSVTVPLLSLTPAFTAVLGVVLLGERPSATEAVGIALVVAGALRLNLGRGDGASWRSLVRSLTREKGSLLMVFVAAVWSLALPLDKLALRAASPPVHGLVLTSGVALGVAVLVVARRQLGELRRVGRAPGLLALALAASTVGLGLQLVAMQLAWVSLVETLKRGIGNVMAVVFGRAVFGEGVSWAKVGAVLLMAAGVALILGT